MQCIRNNEEQLEQKATISKAKIFANKWNINTSQSNGSIKWIHSSNTWTPQWFVIFQVFQVMHSIWWHLKQSQSQSQSQSQWQFIHHRYNKLYGGLCIFVEKFMQSIIYVALFTIPHCTRCLAENGAFGVHCWDAGLSVGGCSLQFCTQLILDTHTIIQLRKRAPCSTPSHSTA